MQKITSTLTALLVLVLIAGCGGGKKEVSKLHQDQAAKHASDANMENFLRNYTAAEKSLTQATTLNPTIDDYWIELGKVRVRLGDKSGAIKAYKGALAACDAQLKEVAENPVFIERKLRALVMLGRDDDARKVLAKAVKNYPQNTHLKTLDQVKAVDLFKNDARLKDFIVK